MLSFWLSLSNLLPLVEGPPPSCPSQTPKTKAKEAAQRGGWAMDGPHSQFTRDLATLSTYCALSPSFRRSRDFSGQQPRQDRRIMNKGRVFARLPFLASIASPESGTSSLTHFESARGAPKRPAEANCGSWEFWGRMGRLEQASWVNTIDWTSSGRHFSARHLHMASSCWRDSVGTQNSET